MANSKHIPCSCCREMTKVDEEAESVFCSRCVVKRMNYLDNKVLTPENCKKMRGNRTPLSLAREVGCLPGQIKSFEAGSRSCPPELVPMMYEWFYRGGR